MSLMLPRRDGEAANSAEHRSMAQFRLGRDDGVGDEVINRLNPESASMSYILRPNRSPSSDKENSRNAHPA